MKQNPSVTKSARRVAAIMIGLVLLVILAKSCLTSQIAKIENSQYTVVALLHMAPLSKNVITIQKTDKGWMNFRSDDLLEFTLGHQVVLSFLSTDLVLGGIGGRFYDSYRQFVINLSQPPSELERITVFSITDTTYRTIASNGRFILRLHKSIDHRQILRILARDTDSSSKYFYELVLVSAKDVRAEFTDTSILKLDIEWPNNDVRIIYVNLDVIVDKMHLTGITLDEVRRR